MGKKAEDLGAGEILLTSMDCDGTKAGYDLELTRAVADAVDIPVIASGEPVLWNIFMRRLQKEKQMQFLLRHYFITKNWKSVR